MKLLISPGYNAGWSTWNCPEMATDKKLIEFFEKGCTLEEMGKFLIENNFKDGHGGHPYLGGFHDLKVEEVPKGTLFRINEYDGSEFIETFNSDDWMIAED